MSTASTINTETSWKVVNLLSDWERNQHAWDRFVDEHEKGSVFHTSHMVRVFQDAKGHTVLPLAAMDWSGEIIALLVAVRVQTLRSPLGGISSRSILYAEPLCRDEPVAIEALASLVASHDRMMRRQVVFSEVRPLFAAGAEKIALERCGYEFRDYLNYTIDLTPPLDELWTKMRKSARRGVRQCQRHGFHMQEVGGPEGIKLLYHFLKLSYGNSRVPLADRSLFDEAFKRLHPLGMLKLFATCDGDKPVAMDSLLVFKGRAFAWYGGLVRLTGVSPFDYLQWYEIAWAQQNGCTLYDFGGAGWPDEPYGVREYKAKFGGELVSFGRYRKVYSPWKMKLAERAYQLGRTVISPK
jgi:CelD/BcsL family acetyltransferase involved in cellulose biosynthesis